MIELVDIEKTYNTRYGVKRVIKPTSLAFYRGASTAVLGLNGAGKSTLLRMIGGVEKPDRGKVVKTVTVSPPLGITNTFNGALTGAENLKFVCRLYDIDIKRAEAFVEDFADLGPYFHEPVRTYSSGMRGRLAFGMSMAVDFQVYLIDEGLSAGDARFRQKSRDAFERRKSRSDIIMTSHNMNTIRDFCTRAVVIDDGNVTPFEDLDAAEEFYMEVVARRR
ncbi:ABC transporter ATP-binding protein [Brevundimonas sp.]|uniref:ABC transporter ATP-binding protein n=1 Tax=Brevundimonas sp. TaxID=1871086 RepID=UPI0035ADA732